MRTKAHPNSSAQTVLVYVSDEYSTTFVSCSTRRETPTCVSSQFTVYSVQTKIHVFTRDFDFLHNFAGFVADFYVNSDGLPVVIDLNTRNACWATIFLRISEYIRSFQTSFSREASTWTGLSLIMNCLVMSAFGPDLFVTGANWILRIIRRHVSLTHHPKKDQKQNTHSQRETET